MMDTSPSLVSLRWDSGVLCNEYLVFQLYYLYGFIQEHWLPSWSHLFARLIHAWQITVNYLATIKHSTKHYTALQCNATQRKKFQFVWRTQTRTTSISCFCFILFLHIQLCDITARTKYWTSKMTNRNIPAIITILHMFGSLFFPLNFLFLFFFLETVKHLTANLPSCTSV